MAQGKVNQCVALGCHTITIYISRVRKHSETLQTDNKILTCNKDI